MGNSILFIHSAGPQAEGEGSSGLVEDMKKSWKGFDIKNPAMPTPENPQYGEWKAVLKEEIFRMPDGAVLIGHSIGGSAILKFFLEEELDCPFKAIVSIAAPFWGIDEWVLEDFTIKSNMFSNYHRLPQMLLYHSLQDAVVPFSHAERYAEKLPDAIIKPLNTDDHLFLKGLPLLSEDIKTL